VERTVTVASLRMAIICPDAEATACQAGRIIAKSPERTQEVRRDLYRFVRVDHLYSRVSARGVEVAVEVAVGRDSDQQVIGTDLDAKDAHTDLMSLGRGHGNPS